MMDPTTPYYAYPAAQFSGRTGGRTNGAAHQRLAGDSASASAACATCRRAPAPRVVYLGSRRVQSTVLPPTPSENPADWEELSLPVDQHAAHNGAVALEAVAWMPRAGERTLGKTSVPLADVREFGDLAGVFALMEGGTGGQRKPSSVAGRWVDAALQMELSWQAADGWDPAMWHPAGAAWVNAGAAARPGPARLAQWLGGGVYSRGRSAAPPPMMPVPDVPVPPYGAPPSPTYVPPPPRRSSGGGAPSARVGRRRG